MSAEGRMSLFKATSPNNLNICRRFKDAPESLGRGVSNLNERDLGYLNSFASAETLSIDVLKSLTTRLKLSLYKNVFVFFCHSNLSLQSDLLLLQEFLSGRE